ncbi:hypothetical protein B6V01_001050 [Methanosarcinales archaeon ex4572_44]|nr:MAG: hypothetical protein B6U67_04375 [Methanosarcinales archaeon ex4484_138]PHP46048.1 MAG: hypothetical protein B6V01_001050 [Methanosarcinales archaeon ex4572_44]
MNSYIRGARVRLRDTRRWINITSLFDFLQLKKYREIKTIITPIPPIKGIICLKTSSLTGGRNNKDTIETLLPKLYQKLH